MTDSNNGNISEVFNIGLLDSADFDVLNLPQNGLNFLQDSTFDSTGTNSNNSLFRTSISTQNAHLDTTTTFNNSKNNQNSSFLLNHYNTMLKDNTMPVNISSQQKAKPQSSCDHCRRRQSSCISSTNGGCTNCDSKGIKCTYSESPSNPTLKRNMGVLENSPKNHFNQYQQQQPAQKKPKPSVQVLQYPRSSFYVGSTSQFDPLILEKIKLDKIDQVQLDTKNSLRKVSPTVQFILRDDYSSDLSKSMDVDIEVVESLVAPYGPQLISIYFKIIHPTFPILHKKVFLEKYSRSFKEFSVPLLAAVYSLSSKYWNSDSTLCKIPNPIDINRLNEIGMKTFYEIIERPRLSAVQAGLLLLQCRSEWTNNWILMQQVISLSEELGLGLDCSDWKLPRWERGLRRRLAWAIWVQEKWCALNESRTSHLIRGRNWQVKNISNEDFPELPPGAMDMKNPTTEIKKLMDDFEIGKSLFKEMIQLSLILDEIMEAFYTNHSFSKIEEILKLAKPLQLKLREWYHSLPTSLQLQIRGPGSSSSPPSTASSPMAGFSSHVSNLNGSLYLSYLAAEITLHRKIITTLASQNSQSQIPQELIKVCRNAATTRLQAVIEFIKYLNNLQNSSLSTNTLLIIFWHSSTTSNLVAVGTFAVILYVTSKTAQEACLSRNYLNEYRSELFRLLNGGNKATEDGVNLSGFESARNALQRIDILIKEVPGLATPIPSPGQVQQNLNQQQQSSSSFQQLSAKTTPAYFAAPNNQQNQQQQQYQRNSPLNNETTPASPYQTKQMASSSPQGRQFPQRLSSTESHTNVLMNDTSPSGYQQVNSGLSKQQNEGHMGNDNNSYKE